MGVGRCRDLGKAKTENGESEGEGEGKGDGRKEEKACDLPKLSGLSYPSIRAGRFMIFYY